jgi:hypothetical protein
MRFYQKRDTNRWHCTPEAKAMALANPARWLTVWLPDNSWTQPTDHAVSMATFLADIAEVTGRPQKKPELSGWAKEKADREKLKTPKPEPELPPATPKQQRFYAMRQQKGYDAILRYFQQAQAERMVDQVLDSLRKK